MNDLISRQDAIDLVEKWFLKIGLNGDICLDGLRSLSSAQQWIPCSERLPEEKERVLVTRRSGLVECIFWSSWWYEQNSYLYLKPIAWMPLPEPWKGEKDERTN